MIGKYLLKIIIWYISVILNKVPLLDSIFHQQYALSLPNYPCPNVHETARAHTLLCPRVLLSRLYFVTDLKIDVVMTKVDYGMA